MAVETAEVSPTPAEAPAATPATEPAAAPTGTAEPSTGKAPEAGAGAAPGEETFYSGDPNSLPPEIRKHYDNMLRDYKKKTSEVADVRKKAEAYDQLTRDQRFVEYWKGLSRQEKAEFKEQKAEAEKRLGEKISDEDFAKAFNSKDEFLSLLERVVEDKRAKDQKEIADLKQKVTLNEAADIVESIASETDKDGKPIRPDFYKLDEDQLITGYLRLNATDRPEEYQAKVVEAYNWAKALTGKFFELGKAEGLKIVQAKAAASTEPPTQGAKPAYSGPDPKNIDVRTAVELARKGIRVPRDF